MSSPFPTIAISLAYAYFVKVKRVSSSLDSTHRSRAKIKATTQNALFSLYYQCPCKECRYNYLASVVALLFHHWYICINICFFASLMHNFETPLTFAIAAKFIQNPFTESCTLDPYAYTIKIHIIFASLHSRTLCIHQLQSLAEEIHAIHISKLYPPSKMWFYCSH